MITGKGRILSVRPFFYSGKESGYSIEKMLSICYNFEERNHFGVAQTRYSFKEEVSCVMKSKAAECLS